MKHTGLSVAAVIVPATGTPTGSLGVVVPLHPSTVEGFRNVHVWPLPVETPHPSLLKTSLHAEVWGEKPLWASDGLATCLRLCICLGTEDHWIRPAWAR